MMAVLASDISVVLSGGSSNADPNASLGGDPSGAPITGYLDNLFDNISETDSQGGMTDYRCIYVFNDNESDAFYNVNFYIASQVEGGAQVALGIPLVSEVQVITVTGTVTGGSLTLGYGTTDAVATQGTSSLGDSLQEQLGTIPQCSGVTVTSSVSGGNTTLTVTFSAGRNHPILTLVDNSLLGTGSLDVSIAKTVDGGPINTIASPIDNELTTPTGIAFTSPDSQSPVLLGDLYPLEGFPVWIRRSIDAGTPGVEGDGAVLRITGKPFITG